ncbi:unnamed protein product [Ceutorhynchus assimilis]|uniref:C2H2-type domain-containing protein n=1 Tax=Ceutorhynchus assimilis TaxID=467358 RepID=A0A9N9MS34_9CUCU|nr:unnamed protein product [Ceutorhynchus assimilis]
MDNMNVTTKCMTLSPGELAKLGVELDSLAPTANAHPKNDNVAHAIETPATTSQDQKTYGIYSKVEMERESNSLIMNNSSNDENDDIPIKVLTQTSLNDFITNTDSQKKLVSDKMAIQKRKPGRPKLNGTKQDNSNGRKRQINKHIASSDSDSDIPLSKILKNSDGKIETCSTSEKTNITIDSNSIKQPDSLVNESVSDAPKKKRGRPKKSDVPVVVPVESKEEIIFTKSKKGRQRKEIDYSLLEDCEPKSTNSSPTVTKPSKKVSKYKYSGNTTLALKQIFSSFEGKNADDVSIDESNSRKRGRRVIKDDFSDEEGTVTCAVCSETVTNQDWADHKRKVHYNLAWKKGETAINVSDNSAIMNVYEQLRKEQGFLKCKKCKKKCAKSKEFMLHLEKCNEIVKANGMVICAVCKKELSKNEWTYHKYKEHNNLAWREGDQELNLNDQDIVMRILTQLYKSKKPLHCEKCKVQKKSVVGYLSHKTVCQKSQEEMESVKVACKLCGQKVLPVSMDYHLKAHNKPEWPKQISASDYFSVDVGTGGKRKAATRALNVIKSIKGVNSSKYYTEQCDFEESWVLKRLRKKYTDIDQVFCIFNNNNCEFKSDSLENLIHHLNSCENKPEQYFVCKLCLVWTRDEVEIENHVKIDHNKVNVDNDGEFNDVGVEEENESDVDKFEDELLKEQHKLRQNRKQLLTGTSLVHKVKPIFLVYPMREQKSLFYPQAYPWMMNFCEKRYSNCYLFESFRSKEPHRVLDCDILDEYLPKLLESCDISVKELNVNDKLGDLEFRKLGLFEVSKSYKGESTIYCGGPIACLAWLPTPFQAEIYDQILAVSVINHPEKEYAVGETYSEPSVIQFWNCGQVHWQKDDDFNPYLLFGLALSTGPIWHMEWCPSGCLDLANNDKLTCRLGLLAVATSDSYAYIYSIDNIKEENDKGLIYKCEPSVKLQLENVKTSTNYYATKISWTKAKDHRYIAVGYSSGIVAIFDLLSSSTLWQKENQEGTRIILPYLTFQAHVSCVTSLSLCHYGEGNRWCFTTGLDKVTTFWDLSNMTKQMTNKKYGVSDGQFLTQWPVALCAEDETTFNDTVSAHSFIRPIREVLSSDFCCFTNSPSGIKSVSFSDWLNLILHGSNAGEVMGQFSHRMFFNIDKKQFKSNYVKCIFSIAKLISKNNDTKPPLCSTFEEAREHYGIVFTDYNSDKLSNIPNTRTNNLTKVSLEKLNIHNYPLQAVTKVAANPNPQACTYWASGYQAGFIRIRHIEVLKKYFNPTIFVNYDFSKTI